MIEIEQNLNGSLVLYYYIETKSLILLKHKKVYYGYTKEQAKRLFLNEVEGLKNEIQIICRLWETF